MDTVRINEKDNVCVNLETGHKIALCDIQKGADVIKYGYPIGCATENIKKGDSVHSHNMKTKLGDILSYEYNPNFEELLPKEPFVIITDDLLSDSYSKVISKFPEMYTSVNW